MSFIEKALFLVKKIALLMKYYLRNPLIYLPLIMFYLKKEISSIEWLLVFWFFSIGIRHQLAAQNPYMQPVNYPYQLPAKVLYHLFVDSKAQIWIGSDKGLFRFNGKNAKKIPIIKNYQADITHIKEDAYGRIWGMNFTKQVFYLENDTLRPLPIQANDFENSILNFNFADNQVWLGLNMGFVSYDLKTFQKSSSFSSKSIYTDFGSYQNKFLGITQNKLLIGQPNKSPQDISISISQESRFAQVGKYAVFIQNKQFERKGILIDSAFRITDFEFELDKDVKILHIQSFSDREILLCTKQGAYLLDIYTKYVRCILKDKQVTGMVQDYQGNFWIATLNDGLWFCPSLATQYFLPPETEQTHFTLESISHHQGYLWAGTNEGNLYKISTRTSENWKKIDKISSDEIRRIVIDTVAQRIFAGTSIIDFSGKIIGKTTPFKDLSFYRKNETDILLIALSSVARWMHLSPTSKQKSFASFPLNEKEQQRLQYPIFDIRLQRSHCVAIDNQYEKFWVGYNDHLMEYDTLGNSQILLFNQKPIIANHLVYTNGLLIVGTFQQGLFIFKNQKIIAHFDENALKSTHIKKMIQQNPDIIWIGTDAEIGFINLRDLSFTDFLSQVGLSGVTYKDFCTDPQGLWLGLSDGIVLLPYQMQESEKLLKMLPLKQTTKGNQEIKFEAEVLNFQNPTGTQILYRIREIDATWHIATESEIAITYNYLPYGSYTLEVYAEDTILGIKTEMQTIYFSVPKKWWQTWWAIGFFILLFGGVSSWLFYYWFNRYKKRKELNEALWISQLKALHAQMNPHFLYNILYTIQALVYDNKKVEAGDLLGNFSDLMRKILDASEKLYISLEDEIEYLQLYLDLEKVRFENDFFYEINTQNIQDFHQITLPSMLLQPFVENALKHGLLHKKGGKRLLITFWQENQKLWVSIEDNGIGRNRAQEIQQKQNRNNTSFATKAIQKRVEILNKMGDFQIDLKILDKQNTQKQAEGTLVTISIKPSFKK